MDTCIARTKNQQELYIFTKAMTKPILGISVVKSKDGRSRTFHRWNSIVVGMDLDAKEDEMMKEELEAKLDTQVVKTIKLLVNLKYQGTKKEK